MAYIRKYPNHYQDGSTCYEVRFRDLGNRQQTKRFRLRKHANAFKVQVEHLRNEGTPTPRARQQRTRFNTILDAWWAEYQTTVRDKSATAPEVFLRVHIRPFFGGYALSDITRAEVQRFVRHLHLAPESVRKIIATLRAALGYTVEHGYLPSNPATNIKPPRTTAATSAIKERALSQQQVRLLADTIDPRYRLLIAFVADTGLRASELVALTVADLDLDKGTVHVTRGTVSVRGHLQTHEPKTAAGNRTITIGYDLANKLQTHTRHKRPTDFVFTSPQGRQLRHNNFYYNIYRPAVAACHQADPSFPFTLTFHDLRHTAISLWVQAGDPIPEVSKRAGHKSAAFTYETYAHAIPADDDAHERERARRDAAWAPKAANVAYLPKRTSA